MTKTEEIVQTQLVERIRELEAKLAEANVVIQGYEQLMAMTPNELRAQLTAHRALMGEAARTLRDCVAMADPSIDDLITRLEAASGEATEVKDAIDR